MDYLEIIELIKAKDVKGLEALYTTYGEKFYSYAFDKWHLPADDAWNIVYKTLETLVLKLSDYQFESKKHFENFIFKVLTNFLKQHFRNTRKHQFDIIFINDNQNIDSDDDDSNSESIFFDIEKQHFIDYYNTGVIENPKLIILQEALEKLEELDRDLLLLRAQNFSYDEIAEFLKIENNQLKVRHHRATQKLLKIIENL